MAKERFGGTFFVGFQVAALFLFSATAPLVHLHKQVDASHGASWPRHAITVHVHLCGHSHDSSHRSTDPGIPSHDRDEYIGISNEVLVAPRMSQPSNLHYALAPALQLAHASRSHIALSEDGCTFDRSPLPLQKPARAPPFLAEIQVTLPF